MDQRSQWIWAAENETWDQYAEFTESFVHRGEQVLLRISADSNYAVYLNGTLAVSGQYPDFPHYKIYDEIELSGFCCEGANRLCILAWYYGEGNMSYYPGRAALRYEIWQDGELSCFSHEGTLSRISPAYSSGLCKKITHQLGYSFRYDLNREDDWLRGGLKGFAPSRVVNQQLPLFLRPAQRPVTGAAEKEALMLNDGGRRWLADLGKETVGLLYVCIESQEEQELLIAYGEHIADGGVRRRIESRDFSMEIRLRPGVNEYVNPFRRLGLRYLELFAQTPVKVRRMTVLPVDYPVKLSEKQPPMDETERRIYDTCVRTLALCMHDHYEDSPWREQALYAMDSRNQMLCGYYAFGEYAFARASLLLMSKDEREDNLLSICTPSIDNLTIPSFSLHYFMAVEEYVRHSGDLTLLKQIWTKLERVLSAFTRRVEKDGIPVFEEKWHWNFYEWSEGMSGRLLQRDERRFDAALQCLLSMALQSMQRMAGLLELERDYGKIAQQLNHQTRALFYDAKRGVFINSTEDDHASVLVNALAILCGAAEGEMAESLANRLATDGNAFTPVTLSMACFLYDALLKVDEKRYRSFVLEDIRTKYTQMLSAGATAFWETEKGESDFNNAGSLCHGWSAMPVYYYHKLLFNQQ